MSALAAASALRLREHAAARSKWGADFALRSTSFFPTRFFASSFDFPAMEIDPPADIDPILEAAAEFASYPGLQNDTSAKEFLDQFPLHVLFSILQSKTDEPEIEDTIVSCLDKIFRTKYGASFLPTYAPFIQAGLQANSQIVRCLACKSVSYLLESTDKVTALKAIVDYDVYPLLLSCLVHGDEKTSTASISAVKSIAQYPEGLSIIFPTHGEEPSLIKNVAAKSNSLVRIRILALLTNLFSISNSIATAIYNSNLLSLFETEINNGCDTLTTLSALELLSELVQSPHSSMFLLRTTLLQLLTNMIRDSSVDSILRSRVALISGRILSLSDAYTAVDISSVTALLVAINQRLQVLSASGQDADEYESSLEALGLIGATSQGATLELLSYPPVARHVVESAFDRQSRGKQLAGLHALASICGIDRREDSIELESKAEENLRLLIDTAAASTPKLKPSALLLSALRQDPEIRLGAYRLLSVLVARRWCLIEVCSNEEIISIVTDPKVETAKNGMDARHQCCTSISKALSSSNLLQDAAFAGAAGKLQEAVRRGPYLAKEHIEAQPAIKTAERF